MPMSAEYDHVSELQDEIDRLRAAVSDALPIMRQYRDRLAKDGEFTYPATINNVVQKLKSALTQ